MDLVAYAQRVATQAQRAGRALSVATGAQKNAWLLSLAEALQSRAEEILTGNRRDLELAPGYGLTSAAIDRLQLTEKRLQPLIAAVRQVASLPDPIGEVLDSTIRPNGLQVLRVRVPLGVVFFIYESRPNVTIDAAALCVKSGNPVILRGGKEAFHTNQALYNIVRDTLPEAGLPAHAVQLVETTDRAVVGEFLKLSEQIAVTIPRGGKSLVERVMAEARMPVIKHYDGICHVYVDQSADLDMAERIVVDGKCIRPGVCNAVESLLVHQAVAEKFLPRMAANLQQRGVELRCCPRSLPLVPGGRPATHEDYRTEYLDLKLSVKIVEDVAAAIEHIENNGSHHTETIVTNDLNTARRFVAEVDSSGVLVNASTRFNDGGEFGLGAEIGISTDKFHARGPCGLRELTSYKYVAWGAGQTRG